MNFDDFLFDEDNHTFRSKKHILQDIFKDWWISFCNKYKNIRTVACGEVDKFIGCGSKIMVILFMNVILVVIICLSLLLSLDFVPIVV